MATMLPAVRHEEIVHDSERLVYEALEALPAPYVVMHSYPWLRPNRSLLHEKLREGEADFLVLHPQRGMLVIEVKGGEPRLDGRTWYRGRNEMRDPFDQARRNRYALLDAVKERTKGRLDRGSFTHGDVVVFPHHRYRGALPLNADPAILIDAGGLRDLTARIDAAFTAWGGQRGPHTPDDYRALLDALLPKLQLIRCVGADIDAEGAKLLRLTTDQQATMRGLLASDRVLVEGGAGSGKTLLALEFAVSLAEQGSRALLLCYNRHLAAWLQEQAAAEPRLRQADGVLTIATFHSFALQVARAARVDFDVPKTDAEEFWNSEAPMVLEQAIDVLSGTPGEVSFDAIIVDEAQDFFTDWWVTIEGLLVGRDKGRLYVFMDLHQSLRGVQTRPPVALPARFKLDTNCRNTRAIARSAARFIGVDVTLLPSAPDGEAPAVHKASSAHSHSGLVQNELRRLFGMGVAPSQIALIGPRNLQNGSLSRVTAVERAPLVADAAAWRLGEGVLVTTSRAFKGLEADIVILYDLYSFNELFTRTDLYIAWTRAKHRLVAICHGAEVREQIEAALAGVL